MATGIDTFKETVADFRSVAGLATKAAIALPLADLVLKIGPPWPQGMAWITPVVELLVLIAVFEFWYTSSRKSQRRRMILLGTGFVVLFFVYMFLVSQYTSRHPVSSELIVHGYEVRPEVMRALPPGEDVLDGLEGAEYQAEEVWTMRSVSAMRLALLANWLAVFSCVAGFIAVFVIIQRRRNA